MKISATLIILTLALTALTLKTDFLTEQKKFERVRIAIKEKQGLIEKTLKENQISIHNLNLVLIAYKDNDLVDIYAKTKQVGTYKKILTRNIPLQTFSKQRHRLKRNHTFKL